MFIEDLNDAEVDELMNRIITEKGCNPEEFSTISVYDSKSGLLYMVGTNRETRTDIEIAANDFICRSFDEDSTALDNLYSIESKILRRYLKQKYKQSYVAALEDFVNNLKQEILKD